MKIPLHNPILEPVLPTPRAPIVFAALAVVAAASQWRADLVEGRRRLRLFILATGSVYTVITATARLASEDGRLSDWMSSLDVGLLLLIIGTVAARLLRVLSTELLPLPQQQPRATEAPVAPAAIAVTPAEDRLAAELQRLMTQERAYRTEDLTVASLAAMPKAPEYRLRRLINQRLGHRNFNAYVNAFRIEEAQRWLSDPGQREAPILTLALDAGMSAGGHTALSMAGGRWSPGNFLRHCEAHIAEDFNACVGLITSQTGGAFDGLKRRVALAVLHARFDDDTPQVGVDTRVAAVVAGVPFAADFDMATLATPRVPLGLIAVGRDAWLAPRLHVGRVLTACTACERIAELPSAGHGALLSPLPPGFTGLESDLLNDPPGFDRRVLPEVDRRIAAFFTRHLGAVDPRCSRGDQPTC